MSRLSHLSLHAAAPAGLMTVDAWLLCCCFSAGCDCDCAALDGGAVYASDRAFVKVQDTAFTNNTAAFGGGVLLYLNATGTSKAVKTKSSGLHL